MTAILDLARVVAHGIERKAAPLVSYSLGRSLAGLDQEQRLSFLAQAIGVLSAAAEQPPTEG
jgi:hypothetical protein